MLHLFPVLLQSVASRDSLGGRETANSIVETASIALLLVTLSGWYVSWRLFRIDKQGKKYYFYNLIFALVYVPFLVWHFFNCYALDFKTGKEHYLMLFFAHTVVLVLWSLGFYGRNKVEESL